MVRLALLLLPCLLLLGCASGAIELQFVAIEPVNEYEPGESRPVTVRIYQLRDDGNFKARTVAEIWGNDKAVLADQLIEVKQGKPVFPEKKGSAQGYRITVEPVHAECRFIGVLALYDKRDADGVQKVVVPVKEASGVKFELTGYQISVVK